MSEIHDFQNIIQRYVRLDKRGHVAEVVLDRAVALNKMDEQFFVYFQKCIDQADQSPDIRAILIWAEGTDFSVGLDLKASSRIIASGNDSMEGRIKLSKMIKDWQASFSALQSTNKPVICAIHGHCLGSGVDLITAADIRMASRNARFSVLETKMAIVADVGTLQRLTRIVGRGHARELCFTSSYIPAERAEKIGLVNHVFEDKDELLMASRKMAELITQYPPSTVQGTKKILKYSEDHSEAEGLDYVMLWNTSFLNLPDLKKAASSFLKKEPNSNSKL